MQPGRKQRVRGWSVSEPSGRLEGYRKWDGLDPFEDHSGPYYFRELPDGEVRCAMEAEPHHCNGGGALHGGLLMTFADYSLFAFSHEALDGPAVTISFASEFVGPAFAGEFIEAKGEIVRETGSMIFLRGQIFVTREGTDHILLNYSGIVKKVRRS